MLLDATIDISKLNGLGNCHLYMLVLSPNPRFHSVSLFTLDYRPYWETYTKWPWWHQNDLNPFKVKGTPDVLLRSHESQLLNVSPFPSTINCFWARGHYETSALDELKNGLDHYKVNGTPYICYVLVSLSSKFHSICSTVSGLYIKSKSWLRF